jgi:hypothetical protein
MKKIYLSLISLMLITTLTFAQAEKYAGQVINSKQEVLNKMNISGSTVLKGGTIESCPAESLYGAGFNAPTSAAVSESSMSLETATSFSTIGGTIEAVHIWGVSAINEGGAWNACTGEDPMYADVIFYENDGGELGDVVHTFSGLEITMTPAGINLFDNPDFAVMFMSIDLPSDVEMTSGFVSVIGNEDAVTDCWLLWVNAPAATGAIGWQLAEGTWEVTEAPFTLCLTGTPPACPAPSNLQVVSQTMTTIEFTWDQTGSPTEWNIEYGEQGFTPTETPNISNVTDNPYTIEGLDAGTVYDIYIQSVCGSVWAGPLTANTTNCAPEDQCDYVFNMIDEYGDGWNGAAVVVVEGDLPIGMITLAEGDAGTESVAICDDYPVTLLFWSGDWDAEVGFSVENPFGEEIANFDIGHFDGFAHLGEITTFTSSCTPPDCPNPTALNAVVDLYSADLGWTSGASLFNIEWGAAGFTMGEGTMITGTADNPYTLEGLEAGTQYAFYVQADCGVDGTSDWVGPFVFTTLYDCVDVTEFPFTEDFQDQLVPPACWTVIDFHAAPESNWHLYEDIENEGNFAAQVNYTDANMMDEWLISPVLDFTGKTPTTIAFDFYTSYYWHVDPENGGDIMLKVSTDGGTTWTELWNEEDYGVFENWTWYNVSLPFDAYAEESNVKIAFHYVGDDGAQCAIDNIMVDVSVNIEENAAQNISIYPNPSTGLVNISVETNSVVRILDVTGRVIENHVVNAMETINFSQSAGMYIIQVETEGQTSNHKVIIK